MQEDRLDAASDREARVRIWEPPQFVLIPLDCEITAYAPDDRPLF